MKIEGLSFSYPKNPVFSNFNFKSDSDFIILKGPSGCGKTTLLKLISSNLCPDHCETLEVPSKVCMIIQEDALFPWLTGIDNIRQVLRIESQDILSSPIIEHIRPFIKKKVFEMSYGQRRLIELFRAILFKPDLLCLDEPFNFLDPISRNLVVYLLNPKNGFNTAKVIMSTHYNERSLDFASETFYFDGKFPISQLDTNNIFDE